MAAKGGINALRNGVAVFGVCSFIANPFSFLRQSPADRAKDRIEQQYECETGVSVSVEVPAPTVGAQLVLAAEDAKAEDVASEQRPTPAAAGAQAFAAATAAAEASSARQRDDEEAPILVTPSAAKLLER